MKKIALISMTTFFSTLLFAYSAQADGLSCKLEYSMKGWSLFYKTSNGSGTITCDDGQTAEVSLKARGGGLSVGKSEIVDGRGQFSEVIKLSDIYGTYVAAEAHAGATKSAAAQAMTKGEVSLSLTGKGQGFDIGIAFGSFKIEPQ